MAHHALFRHRLAIIIERIFALRRASIDTREFMDVMRQMLRQNRIREALDICDETQVPVARIMKAGILKHNRTKEETGKHWKMRDGLRYLAWNAISPPSRPAQHRAAAGVARHGQGLIKAFAQIQLKGARSSRAILPRRGQRAYHDRGGSDCGHPHHRSIIILSPA